jgi:hypothetical protein
MELKVNEQAKKDIQEQIHFYNKKQNGLGKQFHNEVKISFSAIINNPYYQIRYKKFIASHLKNFQLWFIILLMTTNNCSCCVSYCFKS